MEVDPHIQQDSVRKAQKSVPISATESEEARSQGVDSGLSSIEKSKSVRPEMVPPMSVPILTAPHQESMAFAITSVDARGKSVTDIVQSFILKSEEIKNSILEIWMQNLREIEEQIRQLLRSPFYLHLQEVRQKEHAQLESLSSIQGTTSVHTKQSHFLSALDRLQVMERVPPTAEVPDPAAPKDSSQVLVLPITAALLAGGLVASTELAHVVTHPLEGISKVVEHLQPIFSQVAVQDIIPIINLMIVVPLYYHSWNEAVSNIKNRERHSHVQAAQNFAKDVIKSVTDPNFVKLTLINHLKGIDQLSSNDQDRLTNMLKIVLIGVSLSLLYSVEVGKVQEGKFGGIEPEELRDLILGKWHQPTNQKTNLQEQLTLSLIKRAHEQLALLSVEDRTQAANVLLDYVTQVRDLNPMLDPAKIFEETLSSITFNPKDQIHLFKA